MSVLDGKGNKNKTLSKAFMHRSRWKNYFNKIPTERNKALYNKQRNFRLSLLKKEKCKYYMMLKYLIREHSGRGLNLSSHKQIKLPNNITLVKVM